MERQAFISPSLSLYVLFFSLLLVLFFVLFFRNALFLMIVIVGVRDCRCSIVCPPGINTA